MEFSLESLPDEALARQSQAGSSAAFEGLVARYEARIFAFVYWRCRNEWDARELTQDVFVRAFVSVGQYDLRYPFRSWLYTIARTRCIDAFRRRPAELPRAAEDAVDLNDPAEQLASREEAENVWASARRMLPQKQFDALWLRYAEDMEVREIADVLRLTRTHVKVLLFRARRTLLRELSGDQLMTRAVAKAGERTDAPVSLKLNAEKARV